MGAYDQILQRGVGRLGNHEVLRDVGEFPFGRHMQSTVSNLSIPYQSSVVTNTVVVIIYPSMILFPIPYLINCVDLGAFIAQVLHDVKVPITCSAV